jgi:hypothetical protein
MLVFSWDIILKGTFDGIIYIYIISEIDIIELWISKFYECKFEKKPLQLGKPIFSNFQLFLFLK